MARLRDSGEGIVNEIDRVGQLETKQTIICTVL
jgi:hypothetical protein